MPSTGRGAPASQVEAANTSIASRIDRRAPRATPRDSRANDDPPRRHFARSPHAHEPTTWHPRSKRSTTCLPSKIPRRRSRSSPARTARCVEDPTAPSRIFIGADPLREKAPRRHERRILTTDHQPSNAQDGDAPGWTTTPEVDGAPSIPVNPRSSEPARLLDRSDANSARVRSRIHRLAWAARRPRRRHGHGIPRAAWAAWAWAAWRI